ncbi:hypothetical protein BVRB_9g217700 [Beta vulgaris subsp. vulgaris]|nr:hypothetical protein BVRB_9g217700 [Beta vulgaris subsp. vulgaris]
MITYANGENTQNNEGTHHHQHQQHHHESHDTTSPHMDHSVLVFFTLDDLKVGNTMPIYFRGTNPSSSSPHFLPKEEAELIPFSHSKLPSLLHHFGFSRNSPQATAMEDTLRQCELRPIQGETKSCATSLESMLDFVHKIFGLNSKFKVLNTQEFAKTGKFLQNYTIFDDPREVLAPKMVACHTMPYPYVVYYCHHQESESKVFEVSLKGENGSNDNENIVEAVAVCHMDTSQWSSSHVSFQVLGIKPGSSPVCHFFPADNLVWVPLTDNHEGFGDN